MKTTPYLIRLYVGVGQDRDHKPLDSGIVALALHHITERFVNAFGGATRIDGLGFYTGATPSHPFREPSTIIETIVQVANNTPALPGDMTLAFATAYARGVAAYSATKLNQESVLMTIQALDYVTFVEGA